MNYINLIINFFINLMTFLKIYLKCEYLNMNIINFIFIEGNVY